MAADSGDLWQFTAVALNGAHILVVLKTKVIKRVSVSIDSVARNANVTPLFCCLQHFKARKYPFSERRVL